MARINPRSVAPPSPYPQPPMIGKSTDDVYNTISERDHALEMKRLAAAQVAKTGAVMAQGGNRGQPKPPKPEPTQCYTVYGNDLQLTQTAVDYYKNIGVDIRKCGSPPTTTNGNLEQRVKELEQLSWTYPEVVGTASQRSNVDVWNHLSQWVWGHGSDKWQAGGSAPKWDQPEPDAIVPLFSRLHTEQEQRLTQAHQHRQSIETKVEDLYKKKSDVGHGHADKGGTDWGVVVMGILAIVVILIAVKYLFPLLGGLKGLIPKRGNGFDRSWQQG